MNSASAWLPARILDLTHGITADMPVYPGTPRPVLNAPCTVATHGFLEHEITMATHTGTHLDAPAHMLADGPTLDAYPIDRFVGPAVCLDLTGLGSDTIDRPTLAAHGERIAGCRFVLLRTGWSARWGDPAYFTGFPTLTEDAAVWLVDQGVGGVGVDAISVDPADTADFAVHRVLLGAGVLLVENLTGLEALPAGSFLFCCLPLKIAGADGAPVRAVALLS